MVKFQLGCRGDRRGDVNLLLRDADLLIRTKRETGACTNPCTPPSAKIRRVPMTRLASCFVREGLERLSESEVSESAIVQETPSALV